MKRTASLVIGIIVLVLSIVGYASYFKDHPIKFGNIKIGGSGNYGKYIDDDYNYDDDNDKYTTQPITPSKKYNSVKTVMDAYIKAYQKGDTDSLYSLIADFQQDELKQMLNREDYNIRQELTQRYGADYKITYNITEYKKMDQSWVNEMNDYIKEQGSNNTATECYQPIGTMTISGSKGSDVNEMKESDETWICKFSNGYKLVAG